jgi:hypothetical protein
MSWTRALSFHGLMLTSPEPEVLDGIFDMIDTDICRNNFRRSATKNSGHTEPEKEQEKQVPCAEYTVLNPW